MNKKIEDLKKNIDEAFEKNELELAHKCILELHKVANESGDELCLANVLVYQGRIFFRNDQYDQALHNYLDALAIAKKFNQVDLMVTIYLNLAKNYSFMEDPDTALQYLKAASRLDKHNFKIMNGFGLVYQYKNENQKAADYFAQTLKMVQQGDNKKEIIRTLINQGRNEEIIDLDRALSTYKKALKILDKDDFPDLRAVLLLFTATCFERINQLNKAEENYLQSLHFAQAINETSIEKNCLKYLSNLYNKMKKPQEAYDTLQKYFSLQEEFLLQQLQSKVKKIEHKFEQERKNFRSTERLYQERFNQLSTAYANVIGIGEIAFVSERMKQVDKLARLLHQDRATPVLIQGETGTGKEIIARIIHYGKGDVTRPFITINCSAISASLFESELFGYDEGAFTGAQKGGKVGMLELANGGTLFLDEIGDMPLEQQPKLLRVIQEKEFYPLGAERKVKLDIRIIAATNCDLKQAIAAKQFRSDLFYRLNIGKIYIPPLRERKDEIAPLAQLFLSQHSEIKRKSFQYLSSEAIELLNSHNWPGNIRELQNVVERVVLMYDDKVARVEYFDFLDCDYQPQSRVDNILIKLPESGKSLAAIEKEIFENILLKFRGNQSKAAEYLGVSRYTILRKKKKHEI